MDFLVALGKIILGLAAAGLILIIILAAGSVILTKLKGDKS